LAIQRRVRRSPLTMAVELLIKNRASGASELVPVATSQVFRDYWIKGCNELGLRVVPLLEDGLFGESDLSTLISELRLLREWFEGIPARDAAKALVARIGIVISALERVQNDSGLSVC